MQKLILFLLLASSSVPAQKINSVHQIEKDYFSRSIPNTLQRSLSLEKSSSGKANNLTKAVFGFLPYWEYLNGVHHNIRYDLLSHIAIAFFECDGEGKITDPTGWPWYDVIGTARANNVKLIMTVANFKSDQIHKLLTNQTSRQTLLNNVLARMNSYSFDGVNIDFENLAGGDEAGLINEFMAALTAFIKQNKSSSEISFDSPVVNFAGWNFKGLADACDYLFIMAYDFYGSWSSTTGPSSPLTGTSYSVTSSLSNDYNLVPPGKLILGVPYFGNYWRTNSKEPYTPVVPYDSNKTDNNWVKPALRYGEIFSQYSSKEKMWDDISKTPWLRWGQDTIWNQIWYDDESSLALKYDEVNKKLLKGAGIWALGYDDGRRELWNLIETKFTHPAAVETSHPVLPSNFELSQNYPNPFNPSTVISYRIEVAGSVSLKVYDVLGKEIATLVDEFQAPGRYNYQFSIPDRLETPSAAFLSSGIYFYRIKVAGLSAGERIYFDVTKKMSFLK